MGKLALNVIRNIAMMLGEEGKRVEYSGDSLAALCEAGGKDVVGMVADKLRNELKFYIETISPIITRFQQDVASELTLSKKSNSTTVEYIYYTQSPIVEYILKSIDRKDIVDFRPSPVPAYLAVTINYDVMRRPELEKLIANTGDEEFDKRLIASVSALSDLELKEFMIKYCTSFSSEGRNTSYIELIKDRVANHLEMAIVYGFVKSIARNELVTNLPIKERDDVIEIILGNIEGMFNACATFLDFCKENKIVLHSVDVENLGSSRYLDSVSVSSQGLIFKRHLNILFEEGVKEVESKIEVDAIGSILGATKTVRTIAGPLGSSPTVDFIVSSQTKLLEDYNTFINITSEANSLRVMESVKTVVGEVSKNIFEEFNANGVGDSVVLNSTAEFMDKVNDYLAKCPSEDLLQSDRKNIAFNIIGKIMFANTNFYKFALATDVRRFENDKDVTFAEKLARKDYIFIAALELLVDSILDGYTIV